VRRLHSILRKLRLIAASDLAGVDQLRYVMSYFGRFLPVAVRKAPPNHERQGLAPDVLTYRLRGGASVALRKGTTDFKVFDEIFVEQAYAPCVAGLPDHLGPVTLIDLGANIGLSALFFVRALKVTEIIALEPDPGNFRMLSENLRRAGLANRSTALCAFAGADRAFAEMHDSGNGAWGMRMGPLSDTGTCVLPLAEIAAAARSGPLLVLKCDIEGGERQLFLRIRDWDRLIQYVFLELHTEFLPVDELLACLRSSEFRWAVHGSPRNGASIALLLLERLP
jgi:FkbM family methyltransferase